MSLNIGILAYLLFLMTVKADDPAVTVDQGKIIGKQLEFSALGSQYRVNAFLGIPYAEAPVGQLRFKPPVAKEWQGELNAQNYGPACPQLPFFAFDFFTKNNDEDCLVLNVFVPESMPTGAAVMVFIHGGGFGIGAGSTVENLDFHPMSAIGNVIGVTINYRLNVLGFLATGDEVVPGNNGMLDQVEALKWVQTNIAAFGGDPNRVTIFGESAGSGSVSLHTLSPLSKGLFSQAIMQSGTANAAWGSNTDTENYAKRAFVYGKLVGCDKDDTRQLVDCLSQVSADDLVNATAKLIEVMPDDPALIPFGPVVDGTFLTKSASALTVERSFNPDVNIMVGFTADEGMLLPFMMFPNATEKPRFNVTEFDMFIGMLKVGAIFDPLKRRALDLVYIDDTMMKSPQPDYFDVFVKIYTDVMFACPSIETLDEAYEAKIGRVYAYYFNHHPSAGFLTNSWTGANHGDDLLFFGFCYLDNDFNLTEEECQMTYKMIKYWSNFAKMGNPNIESEEEVASAEEDWPQYTPETRVYKELAPAMKNVIDPNGSRCRVWNDFLPALDAALGHVAEAQNEQGKRTSHYAEENQETCTTDDCKP